MVSADTQLLRRESLPLSALGDNRVGAFDSATYEALKQRVQLLKKEQQSVVKSRAAANEFESAALVLQRQQHEATVAALQSENENLGLQLRSSTERAGKLRQKLEKEKRALQCQVDSLGQELEAQGGVHDRLLSQQQARHEQELAQMMQQLEGIQRGREEDRRAFEKARDAAIAEASAWCEGEIQAVRHVLNKQLEGSQEEERRWQQQCQGQAEQSQQAHRALQDCQQVVQQLEQRMGLLQQQVEEQRQVGQQQAQALEEERAMVEAERQQAAADHKMELEALKATHRGQLNLVGQRLEQVVGRKDATIAALRAELQRVTDKLQQFDGLLVQGQA